MLNILLLLAGFVILIFGADKLVDAASSLAKKLGVPNIVIGLTIVAFGTSAPEMVVNVFAAINKSSDMVLGNVIGSNLFNGLAILGVCATIFPLTVKRNTTWLEIPLSVLAAVVVLFIASDIALDGAATNIISRSDGLILLLFFAIFLVYNVVIGLGGNTDDEETETKDYTYLKSFLFIVLGLIGLVLGGRLIVTGAVNIAAAFGLSERIIGLTIVSIGTSLPELATSVVAVRKRNVDIAIGNVVGSNIFNIFLILGVSTVISAVPVNPASFSDIYMNIGSCLLLFIFIFTGRGRQLSRAEGIVFLLLYVAYLALLISQE